MDVVNELIEVDSAIMVLVHGLEETSNAGLWHLGIPPTQQQRDLIKVQSAISIAISCSELVSLFPGSLPTASTSKEGACGAHTPRAKAGVVVVVCGTRR